ncbi:MAG: hypothetical protein E7E83_01500, partial [Enterobacter ludwigii]|nr:hypothetical protein [Enterobacter ludwigii]
MKKTYTLQGILLLVVVLAGCQSRTPADTGKAPVPERAVLVPAVRPVTGTDDAANPMVVPDTSGRRDTAGNSDGLTLCRNDLNSLKQVNEKAWQVRQKDFS